jgi:hypothetical protein
MSASMAGLSAVWTSRDRSILFGMGNLNKIAKFSTAAMA